MPRGIYPRKKKRVVVGGAEKKLNKLVRDHKKSIAQILDEKAEQYEAKAARYRHAAEVLRGEQGD